jgi:hypothetical protein
MRKSILRGANCKEIVFFFLVWRLLSLERGLESRTRTCLTRGARVEKVAPCGLSSQRHWLRLIVKLRLGAWLEWRYFYFIFSVVRGLRVPTAKRMSAFFFFYGTSSSLKEV